ncbi:hypothetical protein WH52_09945 [Tenacibaculum holothuriorum]|uniref:Lipocalin-like domain-containing protein n=1 Tax=Tenacibaculum holothuriorum TaxID=1635173 RepID=A0A1Y2PC37_9FLAO|nr:lipocalin family protein [Tenacibaculum holothuriorum]OSY87740.1 hypothetical protein WH52_09945 [Tenacibaculum holothuriorum]
MKKILFLSIAILSIVSCSSDDENFDPFVGTWGLFSRNNNEVNDCEKRTTVIINQNGSFSSTSYEEVNGICSTDVKSTGTWTNKGNGVYTTKESSSNTEEPANLTFTNNNNTLIVNFSNSKTTFKRK